MLKMKLGMPMFKRLNVYGRPRRLYR